MPIGQEKKNFKYESVIPKGEYDTKFNEPIYDENNNIVGHKIIADLRLVEDLDELKEFANKCKGKIIAVDTETTGLSYLTDIIVGFSISLDAYSGIYVPIRHKYKKVTKTKVNKVDENGELMLTKAGKPRQMTVESYEFSDYENNVEPKQALDVLYDIMLNAKVVLMHNSEYDMNMIKKEGYDVMKCQTFDTMLLPYIYDPEARLNGLKPLTKHLLGRHVQDFSEVTGGEKEFQYVNPKDGYLYAACHDKETEVLTENGWVFWKDYNGKDKLATVDIDTNLFEYQEPLNVTKYKYEGDMYLYKSNSVNFCVTPNHKMLVRPAQNENKTPIRIEAKDMKMYEKFYYKPGGKKGGEDFTFTLTQGSTLTSNQIAKLTALILADGYVKNRTKTSRNCYIGVAMSEEKHFNEIRVFLDSLPVKANYYKKTNSNVTWEWGFSDKAFWELLHPYCKEGSRGKFVPEFIKNMKTEDIRDFIHFYSITDGYKEYNTQYLYTTSDKMLGDLMELCLMAGYNPSFHDRYPKDVYIGERLIKAENCATVHHIYFNYKRKSIGFKRYTNNLTLLPYNDYVYCAEVPNHTLITRRGGKTLISGNCDSADTYGIFEKLYIPVKKLLAEAENVLEFNGKRYDVLKEDNKLIRAFIDYYGHAKIKIDRNVAIAYRELIDKETKETVEKIYSYFGIGPFSLSTGSKEFQKVMQDFNFETGAKTKTGARTSFGKDGIKEMNRSLNKLKNEVWPKLGKIFFVESKIRVEKEGASNETYELMRFIRTYGKPYFYLPRPDTVTVLEVRDLNRNKLDKQGFVELVKEMYQNEKKKLEILQLIVKYSALMKALNSYVTKLTEVDECIMKYRLTGTKSCRLSSGNGSKNSKDRNSYYADLNAQNLTKPQPQFYVAKEEISEDNILGWTFTPVSDEYAHEHKEDEYIVEGTSRTANIRACLCAPKDRYIVSMDYSSQEIYIQAELSKDNFLLSALKKGEDIHKKTAIAIWGSESYDKHKRRKAKACSFLSQYMGGPRTLAENLDIPFEEAQDILEKYNQTYSGVIRWRQKIIDKMYKNKGKIFSIFGRPRQLLPWLKLSMSTGEEGLARFAERSCPSFMIQGMAGDICRRVLIILYETFFKRRDPNIDFVQTVHDEVSYSINKNPEILIPYIKKLQSIMDFPYVMPDLPIKTTVEIGNSLGTCFPFVWTDESKTKLIPKREH